jgi:hypothetical protein
VSAEAERPPPGGEAVAAATRARAFPLDAVLAALIWGGLFALYVVTLAPTVLRSDSGEFHVVPYVLGVAHAPGYPLLTLVGWLAMLLPVGDPAYRMNLLGAAAAAGAAALAYLAVVELAGGAGQRARTARPAARAGGLIAALALGLGAVYWQQSVVGGPRPPIFFFTALLLYLAFRWDNRRRTVDLVLLAFAAGLALTHHPNLAILLPGLALFLLLRQPRLLLRPGSIGLALLAFLLPLTLYVYLPVRSSQNPPLGAINLTEPRELLLFVTATHYQDAVLNNCGGDRLLQAQRYLVFLSLQYGSTLPYLAAAGALLTLIAAPFAALMLAYAFATNAAFGICSSLAMPDYIIPSFVLAAVLAGLAVAWPLGWLGRFGPAWLRYASAGLVAVGALAVGAQRLETSLPDQSMVYRTADGERALAGLAQVRPNSLILSDWESITPIWYGQKVEGVNSDTKSAMVTASPNAPTWLIETEQGLADRPVSLAQRVPAIGEQYRQFPVGAFHEVQQRKVTERATNVGLLSQDRAVRLLGYRLDRPVAAPGELVALTIYAKTDRGAEELYLPLIRLGEGGPLFRFDDSLRYASSTWSDHEVIGGTYHLVVPASAPPGPLSLDLAYQVASTGRLVGLSSGGPWTRLAQLEVTAPTGPARAAPDGALASFGQQIVLHAGRASVDGSPIDLTGQPGLLRLRPGRPLELELEWSSLRWLDESYTLFIHLLDADNRLVAQHDALPLGGVYHTYKWVPGQIVKDWYRLQLPADLPTGQYTLEIGAYHSMTTRRLPLLDATGGAKQTAFLWGLVELMP